jgi:DNA-binding response OmpR family regulator
VNESSASSNKSEGRILVLEPDEELSATILRALLDAAPAATVDVARSVEDAQRIVLEDRPDLFVLDMDASEDLGQDFLLDLRTSHPRARAIILTEVHLPAQRQQAAGIGAIHFLEKPFPHSDFVDLVQALLRPDQAEESEKFQGTLSDLHLSDIIQLKCMSGTTTALEFTGPQGEKARVYFDHGQVRHAVAPGREGVEAFNEIVSWKGGKISEVHGTGSPPRTIDMDWQFLLMEAVRKMDETSARRDRRKRAQPSHRQKILVIDDSLMLLSFVQEILAEANYDVITAATAEEGMQATREQRPHLILLDYLLPDLKGDEVSRRLAQDEETGHIPILFMSGFGADLETAQTQSANVFGILNKPFTSDLLLKAIDQHLPKLEEEQIVEEEEELEAEAAVSSEFTNTIGPEVEPAESGLASSGFGSSVFGPTTPLWSETPPYAKLEEAPAAFSDPTVSPQPAADISPAAQMDSSSTGNIYFSGETNFFSLNLALRTIGKEKLTGVLRCFWTKNDVELYAREGRVALVTTRNAELYCSEAPITLVNIDPERVGQAREEQARTGAPIFLTLAREHAILRDPALQLVQHYGQKLFAQLWSVARVRFVFEQLPALPDFTQEAPPDEEVDHWTLATLRFIQFQDITDKVAYDPACVPAYTRDGFERVQNLRLTVAEAQFASQFNGARSIAQIARNLRLDLKFARLTLFRFLALEIVECWPPSTPEKMERGGMLKRFGRSIGIGD